MGKYPELDNKIDFRVECVLKIGINGIFDDYSNQFYSVVLKLDGFDTVANTVLNWVEFSGGYCTRGDEDDKRIT